jgi:hypothetical protein
MAQRNDSVEGGASSEEVKELRKQAIMKSTKGAYIGPAVTFVLYAADTKRDFLNPVFSERFCVLEGMGASKKAKRSALAARKKRVKEALLKADVRCPPVLMDRFTATEFGKYLNQMKKSNGDPNGLASQKSARSAVLWMVRAFQCVVPEAWLSDMKTLFKALKRTNAQAVAQGKRDIKVGKEELTLEMYRSLCTELLKRSMPFGHLATVLSWNLMARVGNVMDILLKHIDWKGDHMRVYFAHLKTDQEGNTAKHPRAVYANPLSPGICPVLAMGLFFVSFPCSENQLKLFEGGHQYNHYLSQLKTTLMVDAVANLLKAAGISADDIASHSSRKGASTYVMSGTTGGPTISATSLRTGWSMPNVQNTYIRFAEAGDEFVGRTVCGLPLSSVDFAILPPHFRIDHSDTVTRAVELCFPNRPAKYDLLLSICLASIVYHREFLRHNLPSNHPLFSSLLFLDRGLLDSLVPLVVCGIEDPDRSMHATGIPPMSLVMRSVEKTAAVNQEILGKLDVLVPAVVKGVQEVLEENAIQAGTVTRSGLEDMLLGVIEKSGLLVMRDSLRKGAVSGDGGVQGGGGIVAQQPRMPLGQMHLWNGKLHRVPHTFKLPAGTPEHCFSVWMLGDAEHGYPPVRLLEPNDMPSKNDQKRLSDIRFLMRLLQTELEHQNVWVESPTMEQVVDMYSQAAHILPVADKSASGRARRRNQLSWKTVVNILRKPQRVVAVSVRVWFWFNLFS